MKPFFASAADGGGGGGGGGGGAGAPGGLGLGLPWTAMATRNNQGNRRMVDVEFGGDSGRETRYRFPSLIYFHRCAAHLPSQRLYPAPISICTDIAFLHPLLSSPLSISTELDSLSVLENSSAWNSQPFAGTGEVDYVTADR